MNKSKPYQSTQNQMYHGRKALCLLSTVIFALTSCSNESTSSPDLGDVYEPSNSIPLDVSEETTAPTEERQNVQPDSTQSLQECLEEKVLRNRDIKCQDGLVYAKESAPTDVRDELERLGATVDAIQAVRMSEHKKFQDRCVETDGFIAASCILEMTESTTYVSISELEDRESAAWLQLYYFAKEYKEHVQPQQYSRILSWGEAILKCQPNCEYNY